MRSTFKAVLALAVALSITGSLPAQDRELGELGDVQSPDPWVDQVKKGGAFLELTLKDAIRMTLVNNLELEIENYNEELNRERIIGTRGFYDPIIVFDMRWNSFERPSTSRLDAGLTVPTVSRSGFSFSPEYRQNLPGGGNFQLSWGNDRNNTNSSWTFGETQYTSSFAIDFVQPLLRGFRQTSTERQLKLYNLDGKITDRQFQQRVSEIIQQVENQYWELVFAIENYEAQRRSLDLAIIQFRNNQKRVEIGVMAPIEITSSRAEVATREQSMIQSEVRIINAQNAFKNLLADDPRSSLWSMSLVPTDRPAVADLSITLDDAVSTALQRRPELDQFMLELEKSEVDREFYKKEGKWAVNLVGNYNTYGTAIPQAPAGVVDYPYVGDFTQAWGQVFGFDWPGYSIGVQVEIPLRNRQNEAQLAGVAITERQLRSSLKSRQQAVMVEVRNAYESIATQRKGYEAARVARILSEEQLEGENKRFEAGLSTNFEVLRYQRDLADAQVRELRAMVDYMQAVTDLNKATFTIIDQNDIVTARRDSDQQP